MIRKWHRMAPAAAATFALVFLMSWGDVSLGYAQELKSTLSAVRERGKLLAGVRFDYPPFGTIDKDGKPVGYGIDVAKAMAEKLGVGIEFIQTTSQNRIP